VTFRLHRDLPVAAASRTLLNGHWLATGPGGLQIPATVPGDVISDLLAAGRIPEPFYETNFRNGTYSALWTGRWGYTRLFTMAGEQADTTSTFLALNGVKMGATIYLNGATLGTADDQFLRFEFPVTHALRGNGSINNLTVSFDGLVDTHGRYMACTGGWDWAPYSTTSDKFSPQTPTFSMGLWKGVYLYSVPEGSIAIRHVIPQISYDGDYPTAPLVDGAHAGFTVRCRAVLWAPTAIARATVALVGNWSAHAVATVVVSLSAGETIVEIVTRANATDARLWWPRGYGDQPLYLLNLSVSTGAGTAISQTRRVGFRFAPLVTVNDLDMATHDPAFRRAGTTGTHKLSDRSVLRTVRLPPAPKASCCYA
jgi:beta-mannosidase